jgi:hypothetical protein
MTAWRWLLRNGWMIQYWIWSIAGTYRIFAGRGGVEVAFTLSLLCLLLHRIRR